MASGIATKIWFVSVLCNTVLITCFLGVRSEISLNSIGECSLAMLILFILNLVFSLPAFFLFWAALYRYSEKNLKSSVLHSRVIIITLVLTAATYLVMVLIYNLWNVYFLIILLLSLVSALAGIAFQWRALRELSIDKYTVIQESEM